MSEAVGPGLLLKNASENLPISVEPNACWKPGRGVTFLSGVAIAGAAAWSPDLSLSAVAVAELPRPFLAEVCFLERFGGLPPPATARPGDGCRLDGELLPGRSWCSKVSEPSAFSRCPPLVAPGCVPPLPVPLLPTGLGLLQVLLPPPPLGL
uniref:(northern house mosquito) hypothetical protein n=1 Tax=Culex pipiens TaxID=7175 RepID=A0A8D8PDC3_CULPI